MRHPNIYGFQCLSLLQQTHVRTFMLIQAQTRLTTQLRYTVLPAAAWVRLHHARHTRLFAITTLLTWLMQPRRQRHSASCTVLEASVTCLNKRTAPHTLSRGPMARKKHSREQFELHMRKVIVGARWEAAPLPLGALVSPQMSCAQLHLWYRYSTTFTWGALALVGAQVRLPAAACLL
jgi:hypothetical protein